MSWGIYEISESSWYLGATKPQLSSAGQQSRAERGTFLATVHSRVMAKMLSSGYLVKGSPLVPSPKVHLDLALWTANGTRDHFPLSLADSDFALSTSVPGITHLETSQ